MNALQKSENPMGDLLTRSIHKYQEEAKINKELCKASKDMINELASMHGIDRVYRSFPKVANAVRKVNEAIAKAEEPRY